MKKFNQSILAIALMAVFGGAVAQGVPSAASPVVAAPAQSASLSPTASVNGAPAMATSGDLSLKPDVNPMTGKSLSEEQLVRELSKAKLLTQLGQENLKQKEISMDLSLSEMRQETEKTRMTNEQMKVKQSMQALTGQSVANEKPTMPKPTAQPAAASKPKSSNKVSKSGDKNVPETATKSMAQLEAEAAAKQALAQVAALRSQLQEKATAQANVGSMRIGSERINVSTDYRGHVAQLAYVDPQAPKVDPNNARSGPVNVASNAPASRMPTVIPGTPINSGHSGFTSPAPSFSPNGELPSLPVINGVNLPGARK